MADFCLSISSHKIFGVFGDYCSMSRSCVLLTSSVLVANLLSEHFSSVLVLLFRLCNPRKLFSWQTLHDQPTNNLDFAACQAVCETTCVNITHPSADCRHAWPKISITTMRKFAGFTLYILKCRVGPSFIHLVMSAMFF